MKKKQLQSLTKWLVIGILVLVVGLVNTAKAANSFNWANVERYVAQLLFDKAESLGSEEVLGGGSRFPNGLSADDTSPASGEVRGTTLTITATSSIGNLSQTGKVLATSTLLALTGSTLTESDLLYYNFWSITPNVNNYVFTLPASSSLTSFLPSAGDSKRIIVHNVSSTVGTSFSLGANTGTYLQYASGTRQISVTSTAIINCYRRVNTDVACALNNYVD